MHAWEINWIKKKSRTIFHRACSDKHAMGNFNDAVTSKGKVEHVDERVSRAKKRYIPMGKSWYEGDRIERDRNKKSTCSGLSKRARTRAKGRNIYKESEIEGERKTERKKWFVYYYNKLVLKQYIYFFLNHTVQKVESYNPFIKSLDLQQQNLFKTTPSLPLNGRGSRHE